MTRVEAEEILDLVGVLMKHIYQGGGDPGVRGVRDRLIEMVGAVDCRHCDNDTGCPECVMGWALPEGVA